MIGACRFFPKKSYDTAVIRIGPLRMGLQKNCDGDIPCEVSLIGPRVEIRTCLKAPFFTFTKETVYNSVTIVDAPRPLSAKGE